VSGAIKPLSVYLYGMIRDSFTFLAAKTDFGSFMSVRLSFWNCSIHTYGFSGTFYIRGGVLKFISTFRFLFQLDTNNRHLT
jgi:hypothetical protein